MFAKLAIPLLALAVTLGLAATPAEARRGGGGHGHAGRGHAVVGRGHAAVGHGYHGGRGGYYGGWGASFYGPLWCPYEPNCLYTP
jgi:hypothetical protein